MNRRELLDRVKALAEEAKDSGQLPIAGILLSLSGAIAERTELELFNACTHFSLARLERLTGQTDWSDDILKV